MKRGQMGFIPVAIVLAITVLIGMALLTPIGASVREGLVTNNSGANTSAATLSIGNIIPMLYIVTLLAIVVGAAVVAFKGRG